MSFFNNAPVVFLENEDFSSAGELKVPAHEPIVAMIMSSGCPHCHDAAPMFEKFARANEGHIVCGAILTDASPSERQLAARLPAIVPDIVGVPSFALFRNGRYIKTHAGARTADALKKFAETS